MTQRVLLAQHRVSEGPHSAGRRSWRQKLRAFFRPKVEDYLTEEVCGLIAAAFFHSSQTALQVRASGGGWLLPEKAEEWDSVPGERRFLGAIRKILAAALDEGRYGVEGSQSWD